MGGQLQFIQEFKNPNRFPLQYGDLYPLILLCKEYFCVYRLGFKPPPAMFNSYSYEINF